MNPSIEELKAMNMADYWAQFPNFSYEEMACPCGDCAFPFPFYEPEMLSFLFALQELRATLNFPFHMTSVYRCPDYNDDLYHQMAVRAGTDGDYIVGSHLDGPHIHGAGDQVISFERMYQLVGSALARGMGIGIKQHGDVARRYIHLDNQGPRIWTYK